ncbi:serine/threonine-protein kinase MAK-like [Cheilinus undulatus]|uniref:serine/threonine-protein kinase MAK-like n=1 Tax=Cheilinus undulatus TaxID=241271 RepID=UPI001BD2C016|nr:serine/threonine-protein kinase MAK-like [Cheilinus undulatus]
MERYESLGLVGEGSYGTVLKCRHKESGRLVAIKKFMDSDDDKTVKKIALREIKLLRQLRHDNLVNLLEVWKRRRRWYLVFEFVERTLLDDLEQNPNGLDLNTSRQYLYQVLRAVAFCHQQNIIHRDIKPENILISQGDVVKLCDFGFARTMTTPADGGVYTDYVATRWYRAPELLVGDTKYGKPVDVWAVGCLLLEMLTGQPLFPGDSDLDQIYHIVRCFGNLTAHHQELFYRNPVFSGVRLPQCSSRIPLEQRFPSVATNALDVAQSCLQMDPDSRAHCSELLEHPLFTQDSFDIRFLDELNAKIQKDHRENSTLPKIAKSQKRDKDDVNDKNQRRKDKKQSEGLEEKFNKEKEKGNKEDREDKLPKTKSKQPSKPKNMHNTSEPSVSTKQPKTSGAKIPETAAKVTKINHGQTAMKSKPGKAEFKKEPEISKPTRTRTSDSLETSKTAADLKNDNMVDTKPKHGKAASLEPREDNLENTNKKERNSMGAHSSCSENTSTSVSKKSMIEIQASLKFEPSQDFGKSKNNSNTKVLKLPKSLNADHPVKSSSPKPTFDCTVSTSEYTETVVTSTTSKSSNSDQKSININVVNVTSPTIPSTPKPCRTATTSKPQTSSSDRDTEQRLTSNSPKVIASTTKPSKTTSKSGPRITKENVSLSNSPSKSIYTDLSAQSSEGEGLALSALVPRETIQTGSSLDTKPKNDTTFVFSKPSTDLQTNKDLGEVLITTTAKQDSSNTSKQDILENYACFTKSPVSNKAVKHKDTSNSSSRDYKEGPEFNDPSSICQQTTTKSKITTESSTPSPNEIPVNKTPIATTAPKTLKMDDKENRQDLAPSVSINPTTKSLVDQIPKVARSSNLEFTEPSVNVLIGEPKTKLESFGNTTKSHITMMPKAQKTSETQNKRYISERNESMNVSTASFMASVNPDQASARILNNMYMSPDVNVLDFSVSSSSPPPPPPPPSSTPLLLPPSSTPLIPSISVVSTNSPGTSDHFTAGTGFHSATSNLRCTEKPWHQSGMYSRLTQQSLPSHLTGPLTYQMPERSQICEHSFLSDRCNVSNSGGNLVAKRKSDIHFPNVRSSVLPELRGREGKQHTKGPSKDQRKDKQPVQTLSPSDQQKLGNNSADTRMY